MLLTLKIHFKSYLPIIIIYSCCCNNKNNENISELSSHNYHARGLKDKGAVVGSFTFMSRIKFSLS